MFAECPFTFSAATWKTTGHRQIASGSTRNETCCIKAQVSASGT